jgi:TPP-dependent pyruvate/acetoin dehydrogenase alpha subunit
MLTYRNQEIAKLDEEIFKRDNLLKVKDELIELGYQREEELQKVIRAEKRKKVLNKWFYLGAGAVGGYFGYKGLR